MEKQEFIKKIAAAVKKIAPEFGIYAYSAVIAQACLESRFGTSYKAQFNNFFGLKYRKDRISCHSGTFVDGGAEQCNDGTYIPIIDQWYKFATLEDGVRGYFQFINTSRYSNLKGITDPYQYLTILKEDGYATSINYVKNVYNLLKSNDLTKYDKGDDVMGNSSLVDYTKITHNKTVMNNKVNKKITIHHMAGNLSVETCGNVFGGTRKASANYGIGTDGRVGLYVDEKDRAWTSSNANNDNQSITIEVANNSGAPDWTVSDAAYNKLIDLCVDICKRNGIEKLNWTGDKNGNLTCHYMFAATACPGQYLKSKMPEIANLVNSKLSNNSKNQETVKDTTPEIKKLYRVRTSWNNAESQIGAYSLLENAKASCRSGYTVYDWNGNAVYSNNENIIYTVSSGDSLSKIAKKYGIDWKDIAIVNKIGSPYTIYVGQKLIIPVK